MRKRETVKRLLALILTVMMVFQQTNIVTFAGEEVPVAAEPTPTMNAAEEPAAEETTAPAETPQEPEQPAQPEIQEPADTPAVEEPAEPETPAEPTEAPAENPEEQAAPTETPQEPEEQAAPTETPQEPEEPSVPTETPQEPEQTPAPEVTEEPTPAVEATPTPEETVTPTPEVSVTPTPEVTVTPTPEPKTSFSYQDGRVSITAIVPKEANLPQDAEIHADYLAPESGAYNAAVAAIEAQLSSQLKADQENVVVDYVLYDIYFWSTLQNKRIEPEEGNVRVQMTIHTLQEASAEGEIVNKDVVHLKDNGTAEIVTDYVNTNVEGEITSMGFTQGSFSVVAGTVSVKTMKAKVMPVNASVEKSTDLGKFLTGDHIYINGRPFTDNYPLINGSSYSLQLTFTEEEMLQFDDDIATFTYAFPNEFTIPDNFEKDFNISINYVDENDGVNKTAVITGNHYVIQGNTATVTFNKADPNYEILQKSGNVSFFIEAEAILKAEESTTSIKFSDDVEKTVTVTKPEHNISIVKQSGGGYNSQTGKYTYKIDITSTGTNENVVVTDTLKNNGNIFTFEETDSITVWSSATNGNLSSDQYTVNKTDTGFSIILPNMADGSKYSISYTASVDVSKLPADGTVTESDGNTAKVTTKDIPDGKEDSFVPDKIQYDIVTKSEGSVSDTVNDDHTRTVSWIITANQNKQVPIGGKKIKDTLSNIDVQKYSGEGITITYEDGKTETKTWIDLGVDIETATSWEYTIPDEHGKESVKITYSTAVNVEDKSNNTMVTNTAEVDGYDKTGTGNATVPGEVDLKFNKTRTSTQEESRTETSITHFK
ncbi:MAG: hypothetical protein Q4C77_12020 [Eubacteriales bacterium]|nr:hypothetical protein [Eubacteriales bacterium]